MQGERKRWNMRPALAGSVFLLCAALTLGGVATGCGDEEEEAANDDSNGNDGPPPSRPEPAGDDWDIETLPLESDVGFQLQMARSDNGTLGFAFFDMQPQTGEPCDELGIDNPPNKSEWTLHFAERSSDGSWHNEVIHAMPFVSAPPGLDLGYDDDGRAVVATMSGDPISALNEYCGANDLGILWREGDDDWRHETAVSTSGEAEAGHEASDAGYVVGYWPGLAFDSAGEPAVAYRDVHFGGMQADDFRRADLEFVHRDGGNWRAEPVHWAEGAGQYNQLLFDSEDQPIIAYYTPTESHVEARLGYWVTWRNGEEWERVQLFNQGNTEAPALLLDEEDDRLHLLFYDSEFGTPRMATLEAWDEFESASAWEFTDSTEIGDPTYDEGYSPSLAQSPEGTLATAYFRCTRASDGLGDCAASESAVVFSYLDGDEWTQEVIDSGDSLATCGNRPTLVFDDDEPVVAYRCEVAEDDMVSTEIRLARRPSID